MEWNLGTVGTPLGVRIAGRGLEALSLRHARGNMCPNNHQHHFEGKVEVHASIARVGLWNLEAPAVPPFVNA